MSASSPYLATEPLDDSVLIGRALSGEESAFAALFHRHYAAIHAFAYRLALCAGEADDIAQDTFVQAARALPGFRRDTSFKNWLYTIATNRARDLLRRRVRQARLDEQISVLAAKPANLEREHENTSAAHAAVREALAALPLDHREAINLVYYENLNHAEAARILGCAESTVSWRLFRAKSKLRKTLRAPHRHD